MFYQLRPADPAFFTGNHNTVLLERYSDGTIWVDVFFSFGTRLQ